jgi:hypothetical protein
VIYETNVEEGEGSNKSVEEGEGSNKSETYN